MNSALQFKVLYGVAIISYAALLYYDGVPLTQGLLKPASLVLSITTIIAGIFESWAWRWPIWRWPYPWLVKTPNLIGTYRGEIRSQWLDPKTQTKGEPFLAYLAVRQTLSTLHVRLFTAESRSESLVGSFITATDGQKELFYTYRNDPRQEFRARSEIHYGGVKLSISRVDDHLEGHYWTDRQTVGEMSFTRISRETVHSFKEGEELATSSPKKRRF